MSKISENKKTQGYDPKPIQKTCSNCIWIRIDNEITKYGFDREKNIRCEMPELGGFVVKKNGTCKMHESLKE